METKDNTTFRVRSLLERMKHFAESSSPLGDTNLIEEHTSFRDSWKNQKSAIEKEFSEKGSIEVETLSLRSQKVASAMKSTEVRERSKSKGEKSLEK